MRTPWRYQDHKKVLFFIVLVYQPGNDGKFYKMHNEHMSWIESTTLCEEEAGYLAIDDNQVSHDYMAQIHGLVPMWIGAMYNEGTNQLTWYNGKTINKTYWNGIQPVGGNVQWCLITNYPVAGVWHYESCQNMFPFLCQKRSTLNQIVNTTFNNNNKSTTATAAATTMKMTTTTTVAATAVATTAISRVTAIAKVAVIATATTTLTIAT